MSDEERLKKWRLVLGKHADPEQSVNLGAEEEGKDGVLEVTLKNLAPAVSFLDIIRKKKIIL